jgi:hypothetical protein
MRGGRSHTRAAAGTQSQPRAGRRVRRQRRLHVGERASCRGTAGAEAHRSRRPVWRSTRCCSPWGTSARRVSHASRSAAQRSAAEDCDDGTQPRLPPPRAQRWMPPRRPSQSWATTSRSPSATACWALRTARHAGACFGPRRRSNGGGGAQIVVVARMERHWSRMTRYTRNDVTGVWDPRPVKLTDRVPPVQQLKVWASLLARPLAHLHSLSHTHTHAPAAARAHIARAQERRQPRRHGLAGQGAPHASPQHAGTRLSLL